MKTFLRWILISFLLLALILFPRGIVDKSGNIYLTQPITYFSFSSLHAHLVAFWANLTHGTSIDGENIWSVVTSKFSASVGILGVALLIVLTIGISKGMYDGLRASRRTKVAAASEFVQIILESLPDFFVVTTVLLAAFYWSMHHPIIGLLNQTGFWKGTVVPGVILSILPSMYMARMVRMTIADQYGQQYLITARSKGLKERYIRIKHLLPNAYSTILSTLLPALGMMLSSLMIVEFLFDHKGVVNGLYSAIGETGMYPVYRPSDADVTQVNFYAYDPALVFGYIVACLVFLLACWGILRTLLGVVGYRGVKNPYTSSFTERQSRKGRNWQLRIGLTTFGAVVLLGIFGGLLPLPSPTSVDALEHTASGDLNIPAYPPFTGPHILGSDDVGHDLLSQAIHGTIPTLWMLFLFSLIILGVSALLAIAASVWKVKGVRFILQTWSSFFQIVPGVIFALLVLDIPDVFWAGSIINENYITWMFTHTLVVTAVICSTEIGRVAMSFLTFLDDLGDKSFMEASEISGSSPWFKLKLHYLHPFTDIVLEQSVVTMSRVLLLVATLGFFAHSLSQEWVNQDMSGWTQYILSTDWGSMLATNAHAFYRYPWVDYAPVLLITITVFSLNFIRIGIRNRLSDLRVLKTRLVASPVLNVPPDIYLTREWTKKYAGLDEEWRQKYSDLEQSNAELQRRLSELETSLENTSV